MTKKKLKNSLWLPISIWNLNEVFTTESISPVSFYDRRGFGNPVNRNQGIEDTNNLVLFDDMVKSEIIIEIHRNILDDTCLKAIKSKPSSYEYSKTIYLKKDAFKIYFCSQEKLNEFINSAFMLLEVKAINKYKADTFGVDAKINNKRTKPIYQSQLSSASNDDEPIFDKAFNQIKGMIYGYIIGSIGTLGENEQGLVSSLSKLKNTIGGAHTDIVLTEQYSNFWLPNVQKQIKDCTNKYFELFKQNSGVFDTMILRLKEVDNLNKMRCNELAKQNNPEYKREFEKAKNDLEKAKRELYNCESEYGINLKRKELKKIQKQKKENGKRKGKKIEYIKEGSSEHQQKLNQEIKEFEKSSEYVKLKKNIEDNEKEVRKYQSGYTYDTSISEQFNRISEQLNDLIKRATQYFLSENNKKQLPEISLKTDTDKLTEYYLKNDNHYNDFSIQLPDTLSNEISKEDIDLLKTSLNAVLSYPQGRLGNYSEENILQIIVETGKHLPDGSAKNTLREYYRYREAKTDNFVFPTNPVLANLIVFFMKLQGHEQINKMLVAKNIAHKQIAFMLYGAYLGFANMPKTFTSIVFDSDNTELFDYIDNYLFDNYLKRIK